MVSERWSSVQQANHPLNRNATVTPNQTPRIKPGFAWSSAISPPKSSPPKSSLPQHEYGHHNYRGNHSTETAGAPPLIAQKPPAQPEDGLELFEVHFSSPANLAFAPRVHRGDDGKELVLQRPGLPQLLHRPLMNQLPARDADVGAEFFYNLEHVRREENGRAASDTLLEDVAQYA